MMKSGKQVLSSSMALRGTPGRKTVIVDKFNNILEVVEEIPARAGSDVQLTIDIDLQAMAEQYLKDGLDIARQQPTKFEEEGVIIYKAPAGAMVVMNPQDGSVLAMASYPTLTLNYSFQVSVRMNLMTLLIPGNSLLHFLTGSFREHILLGQLSNHLLPMRLWIQD